jgi:hypothetical protein
MAADTFDLQALGARWTESRREAANRLLDSYETTVGQLADAQVKNARAVSLPGVVEVVEAQAAMSRNVAGAYVSTARKLLAG